MGLELGRSRGLRSEINVTPFVDVALVLLIIFMVVTPLLQRGKDVRLPPGRGGEAARTQANLIVVSITADKRIWIDADAHTEESFVTALTQKLARAPGSQVLIKGDEALSVADVRRVIAGVQRAGTSGVTLAVREAR